MRGVARRTPRERADLRAPPPAPAARQRVEDDAAVMRELLEGPDPDEFETGETLAYTAHGVQDRVLRQLRRGQFRREAELDLHGLNREKARQEVAAFLAWSRDQDLRCVRVIHGKGNGSPNSGPVLKRLLDGWLRKLDCVVAFCSARPADGGSGALYVLLRRR